MRVLRVYHEGRRPEHRLRERALAAVGVDVTLVVPRQWPDADGTTIVPAEGLDIREMRVTRPGDVNRHAYESVGALRRLVADTRPDVVDLHEEPFSVAVHQWLDAVPRSLPVALYTAQNIDKRFPPPFALYERKALQRAAALYPCSSQAASVARGKGASGLIDVLPLGYDAAAFLPGEQAVADPVFTLALVGRLVPEKGVADAVRVLAGLHAVRPTVLLLVGSGPEADRARTLAADLGVAAQLELLPWQSPNALAETFRRTHVALVLSRPTATWVEQFGRVIVEAHASGAVVAGYASGAIPEAAGGAAVLTAVGDHSTLVEELSELSRNEPAFSTLRERGFALSRDRTWAAIGDRHARLYRLLAAGDVPRVELPRSPHARRELARAEFGPPASSTVGDRPFALPLLRNGGAAASMLAKALDAGAELAATRRSRR
jgi:glycosyltransferase involved in cell wall biosynthesis